MNDAIKLIKLLVTALLAPEAIAYDPKRNYFSDYSSDLESNNSMNDNIYAESIDNNKEFNQRVLKDDSGYYNDNNSENNNYYSKKQNTSSNPQGVIDSIAEELTSARLQQAIILSEIVGKPRSKTRKKRRI